MQEHRDRGAKSDADVPTLGVSSQPVLKAIEICDGPRVRGW